MNKIKLNKVFYLVVNFQKIQRNSPLLSKKNFGIQRKRWWERVILWTRK